MPTIVVYTLARLGLFLGVYAVIWLALGRKVPFDSVSGLWTALIAMVVSSLIAFAALRGLRARLAADIAARASRATTASAAMSRRDQEADQRTDGVQQLGEPRVPQDSDQV